MQIKIWHLIASFILVALIIFYAFLRLDEQRSLPPEQVYNPEIQKMIDAARPSLVQFTAEGHLAAYGFVVDQEHGLAVTARHFVASAANKGEVSKHIDGVMTQDGRKYEARLVALRDDCDLALIKINSSDIKALPVSKKDNPQAGAALLTVGNPAEKYRRLIVEGTLLQLNFRPPSPGCNPNESNDPVRCCADIFFYKAAGTVNTLSGAPVLDMNGEVVGLHSATLAKDPATGVMIKSLVIREMLRQQL